MAYIHPFHLAVGSIYLGGWLGGTTGPVSFTNRGVRTVRVLREKTFKRQNIQK